MKKQSIILLTLSSIFTAQAHETYPEFAVTTDDIAAVLQSTVATPTKIKGNYPADILYACADIKYKDGALKVCELGDGDYMSFRTAKVALNGRVQDVVSPYWGIFWHYLKQFGLPIWLVEDNGHPNAMALAEFKKLGGRYAQSFAALTADKVFRKTQKLKHTPGGAIKSYSGIILFRAKAEKNRERREFIKFRREHPEFLYVNSTARDYVKRKDNTVQIFTDAGLDAFIPQSKIYPTTYNAQLVNHITRDFSSDWLVIKPVFFSLAFGINIVDKAHLDDLLKLILHDYKTISPHAHRCFLYWRWKHPQTFLVSEYAPSKTIEKDGKPYDPTMRVVFMMHHDKGVIHTNVIAGFWKIPVKSLNNESASLTEKHVTIAHAGAYYSGILADPQDWLEIKTLMHGMLPQLYETMLQQKGLSPA